MPASASSVVVDIGSAILSHLLGRYFEPPVDQIFVEFTVHYDFIAKLRTPGQFSDFSHAVLFLVVHVSG
ncbi:MAG: hypothetical protein OXI86_15145, partial [Candidatus Poribacteria bacterium]|nr:hypothetical protein [Candidatus Poribacteria bacterium]